MACIVRQKGSSINQQNMFPSIFHSACSNIKEKGRDLQPPRQGGVLKCV